MELELKPRSSFPLSHVLSNILHFSLIYFYGSEKSLWIGRRWGNSYHSRGPSIPFTELYLPKHTNILHNEHPYLFFYSDVPRTLGERKKKKKEGKGKKVKNRRREGERKEEEERPLHILKETVPDPSAWDNHHQPLSPKWKEEKEKNHQVCEKTQHLRKGKVWRISSQEPSLDSSIERESLTWGIVREVIYLFR